MRKIETVEEIKEGVRAFKAEMEALGATVSCKLGPLTDPPDTPAGRKAAKKCRELNGEANPND